MRDVKLIDTKNRVCAVAKFRGDGFDGAIKHGETILEVDHHIAEHQLSMSYVPENFDGVRVRAPRPEGANDVATILESAFFFVTGQRIVFDFEVCMEDV
jgi:hypothetical protein